MWFHVDHDRGFEATRPAATRHRVRTCSCAGGGRVRFIRWSTSRFPPGVPGVKLARPGRGRYTRAPSSRVTGVREHSCGQTVERAVTCCHGEREWPVELCGCAAQDRDRTFSGRDVVVHVELWSMR